MTMRVGPRALAGLLLILAVLAGVWLWLRDSPVVSVQKVTVAGAAGPDANAITAALTRAAHGMTTLDVDVARLRIAVAPYPEVTAVRVSTQLPHGLVIRVSEQLPVAQVAFAGRTEEVAGDGTLLHDQLRRPLPTITLPVPPGGPRVSDPTALAAIRAMAAAPYQLLGKISQVSTVSGRGLVAQLRAGPAIVFGDATTLSAKWLAAVAVLANPASAGASYIDVTDPARPAAGATSLGSSTGPAAGTAAVSSTSTSTATTTS